MAESAAIEADSSFDALHRLREVIGSEAAILFIVPVAGASESETYEAFLSDEDR